MSCRGVAKCDPRIVFKVIGRKIGGGLDGWSMARFNEYRFVIYLTPHKAQIDIRLKFYMFLYDKYKLDL